MKTCSVENCESPELSKGYCNRHYIRVRKNGHPYDIEKPKLVCGVEGCQEEYDAGGYCHSHYYRFRRYGDPLVSQTPPQPKELCIVDGCGSQGDKRGYCNKHYLRLRKHKNPLGGLATFNGDLSKWIIGHLDHSGEDCLIWPYGKSPSGYGTVGIDGRTELVHVVITTITYGAKPTEIHEVAHSCGNRGCVNQNHLRWALPIENAADKLIHGTNIKGEQIGNSKLEKKEVVKITNMIHEGVEHKMIADIFGVSPTTIRDINQGISWSWLTGRERRKRANT